MKNPLGATLSSVHEGAVFIFALDIENLKTDRSLCIFGFSCSLVLKATLKYRTLSRQIAIFLLQLVKGLVTYYKSLIFMVKNNNR